MSELASAIRRAMGLMSQADLARRCGVSPPTVTNWLAGKRTPSYVRLQAIADACGVSMERLVKAAVVTGKAVSR